jgi:hypothetical protein
LWRTVFRLLKTENRHNTWFKDLTSSYVVKGTESLYLKKTPETKKTYIGWQSNCQVKINAPESESLIPQGMVTTLE